MELGARLECALSFVRTGSKIYDIGSDHGYLPAELVSRGICKNAVVCDINKGPLERGKLTFAERGLSEYAEFYLTDGLSGLVFDSSPCDVTVCGMGGELIASILDARRDIWGGDVRFILQPMTKAELLRRFLWENGFEILCEKAVCEGDKTYVVINAVHTGRIVSYDSTELYLGKEESLIVCEDTGILFNKIASSFEKKVAGLKTAGQYNGEFDDIIRIIKAKIKCLGDMK